MFLVQIKNIFSETKKFILDFFVSPSLFPLSYNIWFKHAVKRIEFTKTNKKCTKCIKKKLLGRQDGNNKKKHLKTWSEEAIDTLINFFQSHGSIWDINSDDYKDQKQKVFVFRRIWYVSARHQYDINKYGYKNRIISEVSSYYSKAATRGVL